VKHLKEALWVTLDLLWRGFGILLFILPTSAGVGAAVSGSWVIGVLTAWGTLMMGIVAVIGYAIATTGRASRDDVARGAKSAVEKYQEQQASKK
jgi:hypothetical protein